LLVPARAAPEIVTSRTDQMAEEKHDAGFKVVDRRSFATDEGARSTSADAPSRPAPSSPAETERMVVAGRCRIQPRAPISRSSVS